jgi:hypothetical protein
MSKKSFIRLFAMPRRAVRAPSPQREQHGPLKHELSSVLRLRAPSTSAGKRLTKQHTR